MSQMNPAANSVTPRQGSGSISKTDLALVTLDALEAQLGIVGRAMLSAQSDLDRLERENQRLRVVAQAAREYEAAQREGSRQIDAMQKLRGALAMVDVL